MFNHPNSGESQSNFLDKKTTKATVNNTNLQAGNVNPWNVNSWQVVPPWQQWGGYNIHFPNLPNSWGPIQTNNTPFYQLTPQNQVIQNRN